LKAEHGFSIVIPCFDRLLGKMEKDEPPYRNNLPQNHEPCGVVFRRYQEMKEKTLNEIHKQGIDGLVKVPGPNRLRYQRVSGSSIRIRVFLSLVFAGIVAPVHRNMTPSFCIVAANRAERGACHLFW
jgi:hypothetical protein